MVTEWVRQTPWRQGSLLTDEAIRKLDLLHPEYGENTLVVVVTHDCDLAQSPEIEPMVEVMIGHRIDTLDGNHTHAKNARTLQCEFEGETLLLAEFIATSKSDIPKSDLADYKPWPDNLLSPSGHATFQRWLAARYRRSAFPDEFERRLVRDTKLATKIAKAVKPHGDSIVAVLFDVDEGQEIIRDGVHDVYLLDITLLHSVEIDFHKAEQAATSAKDAIEKAFGDKLFDSNSGTWQYIELRYCDVISEEALTYRQFSLMKPWRLDHISLGSDPQQPIAVE